MPRRSRLKAVDAGAWYHLYARAAGRDGEHPLAPKRAQRKMLDLLRFYARVYFVGVAGYAVMGNHYHAVVRFEDPRPVDRAELRRRALRLYPDHKKMLDAWTAAQWERFRARLFDVSELMRNVQAAFARWFNAHHGRKGRFWGERFKSTLLEDERAALECLLYVELNAVRAGMVQRPEEHAGSSLHAREIKADRWLLPLQDLVPARRRADALLAYKAAIYYRGNVPTREGQAAIPARLIAREEARGFAARGVYARRLRHFVDGLVYGSAEFVRGHLEALRQSGAYLRRKNPHEISPALGGGAVLREQRATEVFVA